MNEYDEQARAFCAKHDVTITSTYKGHYRRFDDQTYVTSVWEVTLKRNGKTFTIDHSQSAQDSYQVWQARPMRGWRPLTQKEWRYRVVCDYTRSGGQTDAYFGDMQLGKSQQPPTEYDVLACLTNRDPGTFAEFCSDFGYDTDSRKAEKVYFDVQNEHAGLRRLFNEAELEEMQEIQ